MRNSIQLARAKFAKTIPAFIPFAGGVDLETPPIFVKSGHCRAAQNYECDINGGYKRVMGYERFDGRTAPSAAAYATIPVTITGTVAVGDTITGVTSAATAVVIANVTTYLVITKIVGTFVAETLNIGGNPQATSSAGATVDGASTPLLHAQYKNLAADNYRADIAAPTGSGSILGGFKFGGTNYCLRNNAGGTAAVLYKSTASGWSAVALGRKLSFTSGGTYVIAEGNTITGAISGATAVITRVMLESGSWAAGTAAGKLIFASQTGTFQAENLDVGANLNVATIAGNSSAITLAPGGRLETVVANFGGSVNTNRVYGADGANPGFEFDGTVYCPITTGMTSDIPLHVTAHKNQLFFSFTGSVQHSAPGTPYIWSVIIGASEIAMGDTVTGFKPQPGSETSGALAIFTRNRTSILYGTGVSNWVLTPYREELGAYAYTIQDVANTLFLDDRGITNFATSQAYGNFAHSALSAKVKSWLNTQRTKATCSCVVRNKNQYRLFFSDGYALYVTMAGNKVVGMMQVYMPDEARCAWSTEESDGSESIYFGSDDGFVYQMEKGTSFDGDAIEHYLHLAWDSLGSPRTLKDFTECAFEVTGTGYASWDFTFELDYASTQIETPGTQTVTLESLSSLSWDGAGVAWDTLFWDARSEQNAVADMEGSGAMLGLVIRGSSDYHEALRFSGLHVHYRPRRLIH